MSAPNWGEFEHRTERKAEGEDQGVAGAAFRLSMTSDGRELLDWLRANTVDRRMAPGLPDAVVREMHGQRMLVQQVEDLIETGREQATRKAQ